MSEHLIYFSLEQNNIICIYLGKTRKETIQRLRLAQKDLILREDKAQVESCIFLLELISDEDFLTRRFYMTGPC
ncbi:MAG: hypothetical protein FWE76_00585 [Symbiobacteriaceae bacterium]|nr:hypothetical protein [Symbiobacteriaceae bacterium]